MTQTKKIITVCGEINPDDLGITLPHEHLLFDLKCWWKGEPKELSKRELFSQPVRLSNRGEVIYNNMWFLDNLSQCNIKIAIQEVMEFKKYGGSSIVDLTVDEIGRDPRALYEISKVTGLNIIMGTGHYIQNSLSPEFRKKSIEQISKEIVDEFEKGVQDTGIKPGIIGEVAVSSIKNELEIKSLRAAARAQREIGCAINIHPPVFIKEGHDILNILEEEKVDLERVVLSHCDPTLYDLDYHDSLAKRGAFIEYDQFGSEIMDHPGIFLPSDGERIRAIKELIKRGNVKNILISQDVCFKIHLTKWGGWGYGHILKHIISRFKQEGITEKQINTIMVENPMRLLGF